ncbi:type II toxin-antitoxin system Phd/YefM family antitoxin [Adlercreutzia murintestinalis]|jgi:prevent-host-death family protein|uniref:type II toxin-antitoxin system Phd/YefM family antitoxin n=1 Tax=Adlercreutzia murintestinalis TaxID=2941325 RepID=UPI00203AFBFC|nr:type II toxin-antitoxin system Phd/YefM family antitoxin [Adlercreutzia murintestinalis]
MTSITATAARKDIYNLITRVNEDCKPVAITNSRGKGAVLVGEDDWAAIEETLYIMGVPNMTEKLLVAKEEGIDRCVTADQLDW